MSQSLTDKTISGLNWNFVNTYSSAIISKIIGVVLARLLTPKDFGLIGMVVVFTGLADLFATLGLGKSIIRMKNINEDHIRTVTTVTVCSSILIFLIFYFTAPVIAGFYNEPKLFSNYEGIRFQIYYCNSYFHFDCLRYCEWHTRFFEFRSLELGAWQNILS